MDELNLNDCQGVDHVDEIVTKFKTVEIGEIPTQNPFSSKFVKMARNGAISREKPNLQGMNLPQTLSDCSRWNNVCPTHPASCPENVPEAKLGLGVQRNPDFCENGQFSHFSDKQPKLGCSKSCVKVFCTAENKLCLDPPNGVSDDQSTMDPILQLSTPVLDGSGQVLDQFSTIQPDFPTPSLPPSNENGKAVPVRFSESCSTTPQ